MLSEEVKALENENEVLKEALEVAKGHLTLSIDLINLIQEKGKNDETKKEKECHHKG